MSNAKTLSNIDNRKINNINEITLVTTMDNNKKKYSGQIQDSPISKKISQTYEDCNKHKIVSIHNMIVKHKIHIL